MLMGGRSAVDMGFRGSPFGRFVISLFWWSREPRCTDVLDALENQAETIVLEVWKGSKALQKCVELKLNYEIL